MKLTKQIINYLEMHGGGPSTENEVIQAFGFHHVRAGNVQKALHDLTTQGKIYWEGRKFFLARHGRETVIGRLIVKEDGFGFLVPDDPLPEKGEDFYVPRDAMGHARHGDKVIAEVRRFRGGRAEAYIEKVVERSQRAIIGLYVGGGGGGYVIPDKLPGVKRIVVAGGLTAGAKDNQKVEVEIAENQHLQETMKGRVISVLGYPGELATERATLLRTFGFPLQFSREVIAAAESLSAEPDQYMDAGREDLTHLVCCTIDPVDAKDFDDAVTLEPHEGGWLAAVHIADVSSYIETDSLIDKAARARATSVYLPQGASPMLPERLTGDICSLRPDERRRAMSVVFTLDSEGEILNRRITRSWIRSRHRYNYEEVQAILDEYDRKRGVPDRWRTRVKAGLSNPWEARLAGLRWFSRKLREERLSEGGIEFETAEVHIELDANGKTANVFPRPSIESYNVIEEWMLLANRTVTELFRETTKNRIPFVYRVHEKPDEGKVDEFVFLAEDLGYPWTGGSPDNSKDFQRFVQSLRDKPETPVLMDLAIRSMMRAKYTTDNAGHFGLGFVDYTHFTSPIRRYPDILVHRLLVEFILSHKRKKITDEFHEQLEHLCKHCSEREQAATEAEREGIRWKQVEYLERFVGKTLDAVVVAVKPRGIFVELVDILAQSFIAIDRLYDGFLVFYPRRHELRSRNGVINIRLGDRIRVMITRIDSRKHRFEVDLDEGEKFLPIIPTKHPGEIRIQLAEEQKSRLRKKNRKPPNTKKRHGKRR